MRKGLVLGIALLGVSRAFAAGSQTSLSIGDAEPRAELGTVRAIQLVRVPVDIRAGSLPLVVPFCGTDAVGNRRLCGLAATLQVKSGDRWISAQVPDGAPLPGGIPLDQAQVHLIPAGKVASFVLEFVPTGYVIHKNDLRVLVNAWDDENAVRSQPPQKRIPTPAFRIPGE